MMIDRGLNVKLDNVSSDGSVSHKFYDLLVFNKTRSALGGRVRLMISGSAPLLPNVHKFMKVTMITPLLEGYGQTESTGASFITYSHDPKVGQVGGPTVQILLSIVKHLI
jgi:long-chain acyl-CoA synthetase